MATPPTTHYLAPSDGLLASCKHGLSFGSLCKARYTMHNHKCTDAHHLWFCEIFCVCLCDGLLYLDGGRLDIAFALWMAYCLTY